MPPSTPRRRRTGRAFALLAGMLLGSAVHAQDLAAQRDAFRAAYASASQQGGDAWRKLAAGLKDYPLYPYLEAAALEHDLGAVSLGQVQDYLQRYPHWIPAAELRTDYLLQAGQSRDWKDFNALYRHGLGTTLSCYHLQSRLAAGARLEFHSDLAGLWSRTSLPDACDLVLSWAHKHGLLTRARIWQRIDRAARAGRAGTVASLTPWLHGHDATAARQLLMALRQPAKAAREARQWSNGPRQRQAVSIALQRLARSDSKQAHALWPILRRHFSFTHQQADDIAADIALFSAADFDKDAGQLLARLPSSAQTTSTREWRVRVALARRDWPAVLRAIQAMPPAQRQDEEWRYFRARALAATGRTSQAQALYTDLAGEANYFGFLAADRIDSPYAICPLQLDDADDARKVLEHPGLRRAFELFAVDLLPQARREWNRALRHQSARERRLAAALAFQRGWYDRAIFVFSSGQSLRLYDMRFPLARQDHVAEQADDAGIDPAWAYAIARAESAWMPDARSGAGAIGLMQLMPRTAHKVARRHGVSYNGSASLTDAPTNIVLGTRYLADMAKRYGGAPWLASAAYNAGPAKLDEWLSERGDLPPDLFVATIPYHETRDYVARVMAFSVIYDWRLNDRVVALSSRMPRFGRPYSPPGPHAERKAVVCPSEAPQRTTDATPPGQTR